MIIYSPDHGIENNKTNSPVELLDIYPTLCDLAGISIPGEVEGRSIKKVMSDPNHKVRHAALAQYTRMSVVKELWDIHLEMKGIDIQNGYRWIIG